MSVNPLRILLLVLFGAGSISVAAQRASVYVSGAMRNVMIMGDLTSTIAIDTIAQKNHLFGLGPAENLRGEILIVDGTAYWSFIGTDENMKINEGFSLKAPFFVYANIEHWLEYTLPDAVTDLMKLESYLAQAFASTRPFTFKLTGKVKHARIHVVNLPPGSIIKSPNDAHLGQADIALSDVDAVMIGFYSTQHKGVFTHHDSNVHIHLITKDAKTMGHLDDIKIDPAEVTLSIQKN